MTATLTTDQINNLTTGDVRRRLHSAIEHLDRLDTDTCTDWRYHAISDALDAVAAAPYPPVVLRALDIADRWMLGTWE